MTIRQQMKPMRGGAGWLFRLWWTVFLAGMAAAVALGLAGGAGGRSPAAPKAAGEAAEAGAGHQAAEAPERGGALQREREPEDHAGQALDAWGPLARTTVRVWLSGEKRVETVPLELYVRGVTAAEMPAGFELEALKAQAIAARTYIVKRLRDGEKAGESGVEADIDDSVSHQVYLPVVQLLGGRSGAELGKLNRAVRETAGMIVTYEGEPIQAAFFSTSNGYTENSEDYWQVKLPYLRSVPSPWDVELSPRFKDTVAMKLSEFYRRLGVKAKGRPSIAIEEWTAGRRIKTLRVGSRSFGGREVREKLGLRSSQFSWRVEGDTIRLTSYGSGHGVGMSQWGANGLALEGKTAADILSYYYTGVRIERIAPDRL